MPGNSLNDSINRRKYIRLGSMCSLYKMIGDNQSEGIRFNDFFQFMQKEFSSMDPEITMDEVNTSLIYLKDYLVVRIYPTFFKGNQLASITYITTKGIDFAEQLLTQQPATSLSSYQEIAEAAVIQNYYQFFLGNENSNFAFGEKNTQTNE